MPRLSITSSKWHAKNVVIIFITLTKAMAQDCSSNPCMYGICVDDPKSSYRCYCIDGYTGINCEINWDDCWSSPCMNGGTCYDAIASYNCTCAEGFVGVSCEQKFSECMNKPCLNNGTCFDYNGVTCQCLEGFSGEFCEIDETVCNSTVCKNLGECVEGPGLSFACRCQEGWTGRYCEEDVNECVASPCQNGGLCINMPGTYTCACLFGFTGKDCDKNIIPCEDNPCKNNAVCLFEDFQAICYCVPDYHGTFCESRYDDCESKYAHCENGGTCVDGINNFTCSCLPQYSGETCGIFVDTTTMEAQTYIPDGSSTEKIVPTETTTGFDIPDETTTTVGTTTVREVTDAVETSTPTKIRVPVTIPIESRTEIDFTTTTYFEQDVTTLPVTVIPITTSKHEFSSLPVTTERQDFTTVGVTTVNPDFTTVPLNTLKTDFTSATESVTTLIPGVQDLTTPSMEETTFTMHTTESVDLFPVRTPEGRTTTEVKFPNESTTQGFTMPDVTTQPTTETQQVPMTIPVTTQTIRVTNDITPSSETWTSFEGTWKPVTQVTWTVRSTMPIVTSSRPIDTDYDETITSNSTVLTTYDRTTTSKVVTMVPSTITAEDSTVRGTTDSIETTEKPIDTLGTTVTDSDFTTITEFHRTTFGVDIDNTESSTSVPTTTEYQLIRTCTNDQCANTSLCLFNGTQCDCSYRNNCRKVTNIENAAFNGKSYIRQKFVIENGILSIFVRLKTRAKSGILIHSLFDDERYVLLYMETGQLKFQFSCGSQTMLFGELDSPVNNGNYVDIEMRFQYIVEEISDRCSAKLLVNGSIVMSGEQVIQTHESVPQFARLHLGGIPVAFSHQFPQIVLGFVGCMSLLKVNNIKRDFIHDSIEAVQIEECSSFMCLANPCKNFGACEELNGKITCKCVAGYSGETCERSICDENPCHLGATCLISPGVNFICVCPLGMHGLFCEKDTTIVQPSFSVFSPGFSSYMAYGISSSLKDNMELKLRIIPQTLEQISLIAYMGQTGSRREATDHFSITYVRGYFMLTWDLGSGVRRIFTNTPLNVKSHKVHTLQIGRKGRDSWLYVEGIGNVTGRAAGANTRLDVSPILYIGGHKSKYFEVLPHDLPLHTGFSGCIYDIELRTDGNVFPVSMSSPATGRGVGECHRNECSYHSCKNGAVCLNYGPTYSCICMKDWEGPDCSKLANCTSTNSSCHKNSK